MTNEMASASQNSDGDNGCKNDLRVTMARNEPLLQFSDAIEEAKFLTLDTEFQRDRHYYPQWSLLQLGALDSTGSVRVCLVDAMSKETDWDLVERVIYDERRIKVFHAGKQDLEILLRFFSNLPRPIFDSQIASSLLGLGSQCGYDRLVRRYLNIEIDKAAQYTNWQTRPLASEQLDYALGDVFYLAQIYPLLLRELEEMGRKDWLDDLQKSLLDARSYSLDGSEVGGGWLRQASKLRDGRSITALRRLWQWREQLAQSRDKPRQWICPDVALLELSRLRPSKRENLSNLRARGAWLQEKTLQGRTIGEEILQQLRLSESDPPQSLPKMLSLSANDRVLVSLLKAVQRFCATESLVASELLASTEVLNELVSKRDKSKSLVLEGWRFEIFGKRALEFLEGRLSLSVASDGKLELRASEAPLLPKEHSRG